MEEATETSAFIVLSRALGFSAMCACVLFSVLFVVPVAPHWHVSALIPASLDTTDYVWMVWMVCVSVSHVALCFSDSCGATSAESSSSASREARTKLFPPYSVKTWIGICVCLGLVAIWTLVPAVYFQLNLSAYNWDTRVGSLGVALGWTPMWCMAFSLLFALKKTPYSLLLFGSEYVSGITWHSLLGHVATVTTVLHGAIFFFQYLLRGSTVLQHELLPISRAGWVNFLGIVGGFALILLSLLSIPSIRRRAFRAFFIAHFAFLVAIIGCVLHYGPSAYLFLPCLVGYIADRYRFELHPIPAAARVCRLSSNLICLEIPTPMSLGSWSDGQYVQIRIPSLRLTEWHPFTIANEPSSGTISLIVKVETGWTRLLAEKCREGPITLRSSEIELSGFFGGPSCPVAEYDAILIFSGGVGMVSALPYIRSLSGVLRRPKTQVSLVASFRSQLDADVFGPLVSRAYGIPNLVKLQTHVTRMERDDSPLSDFDILARVNPLPSSSQYRALTARPALVAVYTIACHTVSFVVFYVCRKFFSLGQIFECSWNFPVSVVGVCTCWLGHRLIPLVFPLLAVIAFVTVFAPLVRFWVSRGHHSVVANESASPFPVDSSRASDTSFNEEIIYERLNVEREIKSFVAQAASRRCIIAAGPDSMIRQIRNCATMYTDVDVYTETYQV